ncbi:MAG TPA: SDR family oxidoreductase [Candidatus Limnocylindria bacterium]|nr:SDR family oxidoreductase [Candidatus Limnocylindria bacterium]
MGTDGGQAAPGAGVLVTGGAGFIGSNLVEAFLERGFRVRCLDDFSTGKRENVAPFLPNPRFELIEGDVRSLDTCLTACQGMDYVSHQAAWGSVPRSIAMPLQYEDINTRGTLNVMEAARRRGARRFVYASSSSVYGDDPRLPKKEGQEGRVISPYALTKRCAEEYARLYKGLYGLPTVGLRYFNVFGRRQDPKGQYAAVIPRFVKALLAGEAPVINGDGSYSRDFTYVANVVQANLKAFSAPPEAWGRVFNIAYGGRVTLLELYNVIADALGVRVPPRFGPARAGDIPHSFADIGAAREMLGYAPEWDFRRGIMDTIAWYRETLA